MYLKCKQKLCGFPEDINSNRGKILIHKFHKKLLKEIHKKLKSKSVPNTAWEKQKYYYFTENAIYTTDCFLKTLCPFSWIGVWKYIEYKAFSSGNKFKMKVYFKNKLDVTSTVKLEKDNMIEVCHRNPAS